jgi:tetratricopeptide (TPR) repeat protein
MRKTITINNTDGTVIINNIEGSNNSVVNTIGEFRKQFLLETGLVVLTKHYFNEHTDCSENYKSWLDYGNPLSLISIYQMKEYRRQKIIDEIKERLEKFNKIIILGKSGVSKSTLLMEIICDWIKETEASIVLYNLNPEDGIIKNIPHLEDMLTSLSPENKKILVTVDNCQSTTVSDIFLLVKRIEELPAQKRNRVKFLFSAREPDFTNAVDGSIFENPNVKEAIESFTRSKVNTKSIGNFSPTEVKEFLLKYWELIPSFMRDKSPDQLSREIYQTTSGFPIMVKFFTLNKGLDSHVERMYEQYILDKNRKVIADRVELVLLNSLLDISVIPFSHRLLTYFGYDKTCLALEDTILKKEQDFWKTIHPVWDIHLFKFLFSLSPLIFSQIEKPLKDVLKKFLDCTMVNRQDKIKVLYSMYVTLTKNNVANLQTIESIIPSNIILQEMKVDVDSYVKTLVHVLGRAYAEGKNEANLMKSLSLFDKAIEATPNFASSYNSKGVTLAKLGRHKEAIDCYDTAIGLNPNDYKAYNNKAISLSGSSVSEELECYKKALEINPDYGTAYYNKAHALENQNRFNEALACYDLAIDRNPYDFEAYNEKGGLLDRLGRYKEAVQSFSWALEINPNHVNSYFNRGRSYRYIDLEKAVEDYDKVLEFDPDDLGALRSKGFSLLNLGKFKEALDCFESVLMVSPNDESSSFGKSEAESHL